ncbi:MAG: GTP-binding protein TypA/BipA [candidate division TM6 bacterium GW2011_GWF2_38_10]|nr:MAG: GTP-binding protein TypA/BipA [candidate division TM6 bacterium GW2011_GWF2_38_10]
MSFKQRVDVRNIAIIAHVDHGKTTLVDQMLQQSGTLKFDAENMERVMDSGDIERERGITILAKNTSINYNNIRINIVDTPGHLDFGGEVERTLQMVEGFMLLVDAAEGPLPGTRFVLQKALQLGLKPIVLINKIDRKDADIEHTEEMVHDLFLDLATHEDQLNFPILYGAARSGYASTDPNLREGTLEPLFKAIVESIPSPQQENDDLRILITNLDHSEYLGRIAIGRVFSGTINVGKQIIACKGDYIGAPVKTTKIYQFLGVNRVEVPSATLGDIIALAGVEEDITIGTTICDVEKPSPIPYVEIDEPTLSIYFSVNDSPFAGREGKLLTSRHIRDRLYKETKTNLALRVEDTDSADTFKVSGRGQLHLGILVETMRREGFELQLSAPEVIYKTINGQKHEPYEILFIDTEDTYQGIIIENLGKRRALMQNMIHHGTNKIRIEFKVPARGLIGFRSQFLTDTRGTGLMNHQFHAYEPYAGEIPGRTRGAMISMENGPVTAYALDGLQPRGILFVAPTEEVYSGMIIGEHSRENDLEVNPTKKKKLTNMRASGSDDAVKLAPPRIMNLEASLDWTNEDELIEVTPKSIRLRKKFLDPNKRKRASRADD